MTASWVSPHSPLSGCLYRDITWGTESLYPIQIHWNRAELYGGLAPEVHMRRVKLVLHNEI